MLRQYQFTNRWFEPSKPIWDQLLARHRPDKILEIGSYEGASATYLIEKICAERDLELHCIDTWEGSIENKLGGLSESNMAAVEQRFLENIDIATTKSKFLSKVIVRKGRSDIELAKLLAYGNAGFFNMIYVDGSHQAPDVLYDATVSFKLLTVGGLMIFDDYLWSEPLPGGRDILRCPKSAIDAFVNVNFRKLTILPAPARQFCIVKTAE